MKDDIGFKCYQDKDGNPIACDDHMADSMLYCLNLDSVKYWKPKPDARSRLRKIYDDWKARISHAWYALKGYDCD